MRTQFIKSIYLIHLAAGFLADSLAKRASFLALLKAALLS